MKATKLILLLLALVLVGCDNKDATMPTGPTLPRLSPMPEPEPFNPGPSFSWDGTRGILLFAGTQGTEAEIVSLHNELMFLGWPVVTFNTCSETTDWRGSPWAVGPDALGRENLDNLRRFLKTTAELGAQVQLNIFCTLRDNEAWMDLHAEDYTTIVTNIAKKYDHVAINIGNEIQHTGSWFKNSIKRIKRVRDLIRLAGFQGLVGTDDGIGCAGCSYKYQYANLGFVSNFHPWRNKDPNQRAMRQIVEVNRGLPVIFSETTCYSSWREDRLCTKSRDQIRLYMHRAEAEGIIFFFHSTYWGLQFPTVMEGEDWIPS